MQIAFQLTELFQIEIDAVIYTDKFTCYNKKRLRKGWPGVHLLRDNASSHKCEVVQDPHTTLCRNQGPKYIMHSELTASSHRIAEKRQVASHI